MPGTQPSRSVVVAVIKDGQANLFDANPLTGQADQLARIRVPEDFPAEKAVALTLAITGIVDDFHVVDVEPVRPSRPIPPPSAAQRALLQPGPKQGRPKGGGQHHADNMTLEDAKRWVEGKPDFGQTEMARAFDVPTHLAQFRVKQMRRLGLVEPAPNSRWRWVGRRPAPNGALIGLPLFDDSQPPATRTHGRPRKPEGETLWGRLVELIRQHPEGITSRDLAEAVNMHSSAITANLKQPLKHGLIRREVAPHPDGNPTRQLSTWYANDQPAPVPTNGTEPDNA